MEPELQQSTTSSGSHGPKAFGLVHMVLFSVSAILVADTVATSAAIGVQGLTWWVILAVLFFIPYGFVTAELGAAWPDEGGIYVWVREALGPRVGSITAWLYWVNVAYWAPSVFVLFAGTLAAVFWPGMSLLWQEIIVVALIWAVVVVGILPLTLTKWVPSVSAAVKVIVLVALGVVGAAFAIKNGTANSFALSEWKPTWSGTWSYLPIVIYSFMGFELMSSAGDAIREPKRDVPKMIVAAGAAILAVYMFATFGILASLKLDNLSIVTGIADAMKLSFDSVLVGWGWLYNIVIIGLLFTFVGNMVTWSIGANHSMAATGLDKTAPGVFGHVNRRFKTPDYTFVLWGVVATIVTLLNYALFGTKENIFWTIFALSSIVFLLPYLLMFPSLIVLRFKRPDQPRPYVVPLGRLGVWLWPLLCEAGIVFTLVLFFWVVPEDVPRSTFWGITVGGTIVSILIGWWLSLRSRARDK
ncbi:MAG TPA: APC family permease [Thermoleophilia bacterium]|nr:APC family permease [Thermoleophilia bacterium]